MAVRVLFADDQVPSKTASQNERARNEIIRVLRPEHPDIEAKYEEDEGWFRGLVVHLEQSEGFAIIPAKTISEAESKLKLREDYDVAVVDMTWFGDPEVVTLEEKRGAGLKLLQLAADLNKESKLRKPVIAFSQNFRKDFELVTRVRERGALPIQKEYKEHGESGYRMLGAAIRLLSDPLQGPFVGRRTSETTVSQLLGDLTPAQLWTLLVALATLLGTTFFLGVKLEPLFQK